MAEVQHDNSAEHVVSEKKDLSASDDVPDSFGTMTKDDKRAFICLWSCMRYKAFRLV